ncbi:MAG TPA: CAP domain-containing protein [Acidimicrobiia bacterium]|nr:CAP domain-containing protein [Acidimicrobiia bacterium]
MLGKTRWLSILLVIVVGAMGLAASAGADSGTEGSFLSALNSYRNSNGLGSLTVDGGLRSHARNHTADMIAAGDWFHSSSAELQAAAGSGWTKLGENVGHGPSVSSLHDAFVNSPSHRANMLGDYNYVGIGTGTSSDGRLFVTVVFMKKGSTAPATTTSTAPPKTSSPPKAPAQPSKSSSSPAPANQAAAPSTTTTTLAPTTTTTLIVGPDKPVTPGVSCFEATRFGWTCHD